MHAATFRLLTCESLARMLESDSCANSYPVPYLAATVQESPESWLHYGWGNGYLSGACRYARAMLGGVIFG